MSVKNNGNNECVSVYTDGATVGHNGKFGTVTKVGIGIYIPEKNFEFSKVIDGLSNNEAEFKALIIAMKILVHNNVTCANFFSDSKIIVDRASRGFIKVQKKKKHINERMNNFQKEVMELEKNFVHITFTWIPREENERADILSKQCM